MSQPGNTPGIATDVRFVNLRYHRAALRDCLPSILVLTFAGVMMVLGLFVVDSTPHTPPLYPKSIELTVGAGAAIVTMAVAIVVRYQQHLASSRRRG